MTENSFLQMQFQFRYVLHISMLMLLDIFLLVWLDNAIIMYFVCTKSIYFHICEIIPFMLKALRSALFYHVYQCNMFDSRLHCMLSCMVFVKFNFQCIKILKLKSDLFSE